MKEVKGDLWDFHKQGHWICITTNGTVRKDGCLVMGRGCALEAALKWPSLSKNLGDLVKINGNIPFILSGIRLITFPVKHEWHERGGYWLISQSAERVKRMLEENPGITELYIPRPGCGNGKLEWNTVKPELEKIFTDDRFIIISFPGED